MYLLDRVISVVMFTYLSCGLAQAAENKLGKQVVSVLCNSELFNKTEGDLVQDVQNLFRVRLITRTDHDWNFGGNTEGVIEIQASFQKITELYGMSNDDQYGLRMFRIVLDKNIFSEKTLISAFSACTASNPEINYPFWSWNIDQNHLIGLIIEQESQILDLTSSVNMQN